VTNNYQIYQSKTVQNNWSDFVDHSHEAYNKITDLVNSKDSTWNYLHYNIFVETATSHLYFLLFAELRKYIRDYNRQIGGSDSDMIWMQSWLNFHKSDEVLDWHGHPWEFHGYISIDPKKSKTIFREWEIYNEIGQVYIGPGSNDDRYHHKVEVLEPYEGDRITIGFDCTKRQNEVLQSKMIPIL